MKAMIEKGRREYIAVMSHEAPGRYAMIRPGQARGRLMIDAEGDVGMAASLENRVEWAEEVIEGERVLILEDCLQQRLLRRA